MELLKKGIPGVHFVFIFSEGSEAALMQAPLVDKLFGTQIYYCQQRTLRSAVLMRNLYLPWVELKLTAFCVKKGHCFEMVSENACGTDRIGWRPVLRSLPRPIFFWWRR